MLPSCGSQDMYNAVAQAMEVQLTFIPATCIVTDLNRKENATLKP